MKILAIAPQPFFSPRGTPFSVYYRTMIKAELGHKVDLLTYGQGQDVDIPGVNIIRIPQFKSMGEVKIGPSPFKLFLDAFILLWTIGLLLRNRYKVVHAHEEAVFICLLLKPLFRFKLLYDMHSSLPQQLENFNFTKSKLLIGLFTLLEDWSINSANAVITICPDLYEYARRRAINPEHIVLIENSIFEPIRYAKNSDELKLLPPLPTCIENSKKKVVVYAGTLEEYQGIDILIRAFKLTVSHIKDAHLLIVGGTPDQVMKYKKLAQKCGIENNVEFTGQLTPQSARQCNQMSNLLVSPRSKGTNTPLKIYEQLASGIPIVATNIHSHTQILNPKLAILVDPTPEALARGLIQGLEDNQSQQMAENAQKLYDKKYSRPVYEFKMNHVLGMVC